MKKKRWLALLVAAAMVCMMLPITALAAGGNENIDSFSLTVNNYTVGETWDGKNVTANSDKLWVQTAKLVRTGSGGDVEITEPLKAHDDTYRYYFYIWTKAGYSFDIDNLQDLDVTISVNGQTVKPYAIRDGGDNGRSIVMDIVAPVLHDYGEYQYDGTNHWKECQDPACPNKEDSIKATTANHSFGEWTEVKAPTETQEGTKERSCVCGYKESEVIPPTGEHGETEIVGAKEATCTEEGYTGDTVCKGCGEVIEQGKVIAKLAHTYQDGKCTVCGAADPNYVPAETTPAPTSTPDPTNTPNPTSTPASTDRESTESPKTGDNSNMMLWGMLLLAAGAGIAGTVVYGRKRAAKH